MDFHVQIMQSPPLWGPGGDYGRSGVNTEKMGQRAVSKRSLGVKIGHNPGKTLKKCFNKIFTTARSLRYRQIC